jgi:hypothetical protein
MPQHRQPKQKKRRFIAFPRRREGMVAGHTISLEVVRSKLGNVRFGSADIEASRPDVRFTPKSGHSALQQRLALFDHLVGALLQKRGHFETERLRSLKVDDQLELNRGLYGKLARFCALEDAIDV